MQSIKGLPKPLFVHDEAYPKPLTRPEIVGIVDRSLIRSSEAYVSWTELKNKLPTAHRAKLALFDETALTKAKLPILEEALAKYALRIPRVLWLRSPISMPVETGLLSRFDHIYICNDNTLWKNAPRGKTLDYFVDWKKFHPKNKNCSRYSVGALISEDIPAAVWEALGYWAENHDLKLWKTPWSKDGGFLEDSAIASSFSGVSNIYSIGYEEVKMLINFSAPISREIVTRMMACGQMVFNTYSFGGKLYAEDPVSREYHDLFDPLKKYRDNEHLDRLCLRGLRYIAKNCSPLGQLRKIYAETRGEAMPTPCISVFASTKRPENIPFLLSCFDHQTYANKELVLVLHTDEAAESVYALTRGRRDVRVYHTSPEKYSFGQALNFAVQHTSGDYLTKMDDDDYYGPEYLKDIMTAFQFADERIIGKDATYYFFEDTKEVVVRRPGEMLGSSWSVRGSTITVRRDVFDLVKFQTVPTGEDSLFFEDCRKHSIFVYACDRFNYMALRSAEKEKHTFLVPDEFFHVQSLPVKKCEAFSDAWALSIE